MRLSMQRLREQVKDHPEVVRVKHLGGFGAGLARVDVVSGTDVRKVAGELEKFYAVTYGRTARDPYFIVRGRRKELDP